VTDIEGKIIIDLDATKPNGKRVDIVSSRPVLASKVLQGKTPHQALQTIPLLFNVCGTAQTRTARRAMQQQLGISSSSAEESARDMLVLVENAREHLLRILLDWPRLFELDADTADLPRVTRYVNDFADALFTDGDAFSFASRMQPQAQKIDTLIANLEQFLHHNVFGVAIPEWLAMNDIDGINHWTQNIPALAPRSLKTICDQGWNSQGYADSPHLPPLSDAQLLDHLNATDADDFIAQPTLDGQCYETTSLGRQADHPLVVALAQEFHNTLITRWVARLVELARIPGQLRELFRQVQANSGATLDSNPNGIAQTEAARGRLIHHVEIDGDIIGKYQILAPTEWNFHPDGLINKSLSNLSCGDAGQLTRVAHLMINTIDPCVGYELKVH
jgi:coenzyme F420-reducing hydrogenase alpha subunit